LISKADIGLQKAADVAHGMKTDAIRLLNSAISREAQLSSDAVGSIAQNVMHLVTQNENPMERVNLNF
jgi:hypothetical protein